MAEQEEVMIRVRIGMEQAHYAGDLVDGAHMLKLFGDVATELLIRHDGDEGLFRAYDSVEFLAPVKAGDYIEAVGKITKVGNSSRRMEFVARKSSSSRVTPRSQAGQWCSILPSMCAARAARVSSPSSFNATRAKDKETSP